MENRTLYRKLSEEEKAHKRKNLRPRLLARILLALTNNHTPQKTEIRTIRLI